MSPAAPPEASARFKLLAKHTLPNGKVEMVDVETHAEGFLMSFDVSRLRPRGVTAKIWLPHFAEPGPYMINFYLSFYGENPGSVIETGVSLSGRKGWNFFRNVGGRALDASLGAAEGSCVCVHVAFAASRGGQIDRAASSMSPITTAPDLAVRPFTALRTVRLVAATGDLRGGYWSQARMSLEAIDGAACPVPGRLEWMRGTGISRRDSRLALTSAAANGFASMLSPERAPGHFDQTPGVAA